MSHFSQYETFHGVHGEKQVSEQEAAGGNRREGKQASTDSP